MNKKIKGAKSAAVTRYWLQFFSNKGCTLCGNQDIIDTTGIKLPSGTSIGRRSFCICPNGQILRAAFETPDEWDKERAKAGAAAGTPPKA